MLCNSLTSEHIKNRNNLFFVQAGMNFVKDISKINWQEQWQKQKQSTQDFVWKMI